MGPSVPVRVEIQRAFGLLPYRITLDPKAGPEDSPQEYMSWSPDYRTEGMFAVGNCHALMAVWDLVPDGVFDRHDLRHGTAIAIDLNGDGKLEARVRRSQKVR